MPLKSIEWMLFSLTFREWAFLKSSNDIIQKDLSSEPVMNLNGEIRMEGLRDVAGKVYSILSDLK